VLEPITAESMDVFGLKGNDEGVLDYVTLDEALSTGDIEVREVDGGSSVSNIKVVNKGRSNVLIVAGELLQGAKQNRTVNASLMVAAQEELVIDVACVEAGRWRGRSQVFGGNGSLSHATLRGLMLRQSSEALRACGKPLSDQAAVWQEVRRKLDAMRSPSPTEALHAAFYVHGPTLNDLDQRFRMSADCCGAAVAINGRLAGVELFDKPETLAKLWPKLVSSYAIDALEPDGMAGPAKPSTQMSHPAGSLAGFMGPKPTRWVVEERRRCPG